MTRFITWPISKSTDLAESGSLRFFKADRIGSVEYYKQYR